MQLRTRRLRTLLLIAAPVALVAAAACFPSLTLESAPVGGGDAAPPDGSTSDAAGGGNDGSPSPGPDAGADAPIVPGPVPDGATPTPALNIALTRDVTCVLVDGGVRCWGLNDEGALGRNIADASFTTPTAGPVVLEDGGTLTGARAITGGRFSVCALVGSGAVVCWGDNSGGQSASGSSAVDPIVAASQVRASGSTLPPFASVHAGYYHACATAESGRIHCWGRNNLYQQTAALTYSEWVQEVTSLRDRRGLAVGGEHACVLDDGGAPLCFGRNDTAQAGAATGKLCEGTLPCVEVAQRVEGVTGARFLSLGEGHGCALDGAGDVRCWGSNALGELGEQAGDAGTSGRAFLAFQGASTIAVGGRTSCALRGGVVHCWGRNSNGQLGIGVDDVDRHPAPRPVERETDTLPLSGIVELAVGEAHSCARSAAGEIFCWGFSNDGRALGGTQLFVYRARKMDF